MNLQSLAGEKRFVAWCEERIKGKLRKIPKNPASGKNAQVPTNSKTYGTRAAAEQRWQTLKKKTAKGGTGIVLGKLGNGQYLVGIDLDGCLNNSTVSAEANAVVERFNTYTEVSPSGTGLKLFFCMSAADMSKLRALLGRGVEGEQLTRKTFAAGEHREMAIDTARFYAVTEQCLKGSGKNLRLVPFADVAWFIKEAGPAYLAQQGNGHDNTFEAFGAEHRPELDESGSGYGFRFMQNCHGAGMSEEQACAAILADKNEAGEWARRSDERQINRAWERSKEEAPPISEIVLKPHSFPDEQSIPKWDFLYGRHLLRKTVSGTAAMGSTGKTSMSLVEALAMASGKPLLGEEVPKKPLRVLLICLEDNRNAMDKRIAAAMKQHKLTPKDIDQRLFVEAKGEIKFKIAKQARGSIKLNTELIEQTIKFLRDNKIDVFSIDPFIKTHGVPENDNTGISDVVECYDDIAERANCAVSLWHHTRKGNSLGTTVDSARGASSFIDACRSVRVLETMTEAEAQKQKIDHHRRYFRAFSGKLNFAPSTDKSTWYQITSVPILNGPLSHSAINGGNGGDDVGVVEAWELPSTTEVELTAEHIATIKTAVAQGEWREDVRASMWVGKAIASILSLDPEDDKPKIRKLIKTLISDRVLKTIPGKTAERKPCLFVVDSEWSAPVGKVERKKRHPK